MDQPNRSSPDELSDIKSLFDREYKKWSQQKGQDESHSRSRGSSSSGDPSQTHAPGQIPDSTPGDHSNSNDLSEAKRTETESGLPGHKIHGFKNEILSLKNFLLKQTDSEEFKTLAVVGKYGVGKTALCQVMFNDEDVKTAYVPRLWVSMYKAEQGHGEGARIAILKRILENLGVEEETFEHIEKEAKKEAQGEGVQREELARLLYVLYLNLWGKKYLIVLDDARKEDGWNERLDEEVKIPEGDKWGTHLSFGFPKGSGGRVLVTSRDEKLGKELVGEEQKLHRLYPFSDPESVWNIYKDAAGASGIDVNPRNQRKYKEDLMNKSCGIPLAARMLGKNQPVEEEEEEEVTWIHPINGQTGSTNGTTTQNP